MEFNVSGEYFFIHNLIILFCSLLLLLIEFIPLPHLVLNRWIIIFPVKLQMALHIVQRWIRLSIRKPTYILRRCRLVPFLSRNISIVYCELIIIAVLLLQMNHNPQVKRMLSTDNHYEVLGVPRNANNKEIKKAYRQMALKYHPDKNPIPQAKQVFNKIVHSYNILSDDAQRKNHDAEVTRPKQQQPQMPQKEQRPNKDTKKSSTHFKSHYYEESKQDRDFSKRPQTNKNTWHEPKRPERMPEFPNSNKKPTMPEQNHNSRSQERPKYRSSYVQRKNNNGIILLTVFFFLMVWYFMPSFVGTPLFLLTSGGQYTLKLKTQQLKVPYYVKIDYDQLNPIPDQTIQRAFVRKLQKQCQKSLNQKKMYEKMASRAFNEAQQNTFIASAENVSLKACKKIIKLIKKHPNLKLTTFSNNLMDL